MLDAAALLDRCAAQDLPDDALFFDVLVRTRDGVRARTGGARVRVYGEMVDLLWQAGRTTAALHLGALWNDLCKRERLALLCSYHLDGFAQRADVPLFRTICAAHATVQPTEAYLRIERPEEWLRQVAALQRQARALETEIGERRHAEERLALLATASDLLTASLDYETTLNNVVELTLPKLGDFGFFDGVEERGTVRRIARSYRDPARQALLQSTRRVRSDRRDVNLCALSLGQSGFHPEIGDTWLRDAAANPGHLVLMRELGFCSMSTVPLAYQGRLLGALTLFFANSGPHHTRSDLALAEELARRAAAAVENARLYREMQEAVRRKEEADRRKDDFLAMLGHELRNPLAPILTALQVMQLRGEAAATREWAVIDRQAQHLVHLVDDLLDISRITRGKIELRREPVELADVLAKAVETASPLLERRNHALTVSVPREGLTVLADQGRLQQVFANLLTNAAKYTEPGGRIVLSAACSGDEEAVEVQDNGIGIARE